MWAAEIRPGPDGGERVPGGYGAAGAGRCHDQAVWLERPGKIFPLQLTFFFLLGMSLAVWRYAGELNVILRPASFYYFP